MEAKKDRHELCQAAEGKPWILFTLYLISYAQKKLSYSHIHNEENKMPKTKVITESQWSRMLHDINLSDKEMVVAMSIRIFLNQASDARQIMESVVVSGDEENVAIDQFELADMINAALDCVGDLLNGEYKEDPQDGRTKLEELYGAVFLETVSDMLGDIDGYDFVRNIGGSYEEMLYGSGFAEFLARLSETVCR